MAKTTNNTEPKKKSKKSIIYSEDERKKALIYLYESGNKLTQTCKELKISPNTLIKWRDSSMGQELYAHLRETRNIPQRGDNAVQMLHEDILDHKQNFIENAFSAKEAALDRIKELIPQEKSLHNLTNTLVTLHEMTTGEKIEKPWEKKREKSFYEIVKTKIVNQNLIHNEKN